MSRGARISCVRSPVVTYDIVLQSLNLGFALNGWHNGGNNAERTRLALFVELL
jgi:hypothetical protein